MPEHVYLPVGEWRLWNQFALRGPGFPASGVLRLAPAGLAEDADKFDPGTPLSGADWAAFEESFGEAAVRTASILQEIAASARFQAAVAWQNRAVLTTGIAPFLAWEPSAAGRTSMPRQREELVAHYWQRFCVKNDTIGFFGPVGWGSWDLSRRGVVVEPGTGVTAESTVYFASWGIDALAKAIGADPALREWIAPRRVSFVRVVDGRVPLPGRPPQDVPPLMADLLPRCDGVRLPADLAAETGASLPEVLAALEEMTRRRWITWRFEVPADTHPERHLRRALERIGDPERRRHALGMLDVLEHGRDRVAAAGYDAAELSAAFAALEADFVALTDTTAQREKGGKTAPCRALVYSDTRRSATARIGTAVLDELTPLALCLTAARWMTNRFAEVLGGRIREAYDRVRARQGEVDLGSLWFECLPAPHAESIADSDRVQAELRRRWARIIDAAPGARRVRLRSADIADRVLAEFDEPGAGWHQSRYISPDVLIVADDADAVERGEFDLVLGELHVAMNTVGASLFVSQHPAREELMAETDTDFPGARVMPMLPKEQPPRWSARSRPALVRPEDYFVGMVDYTADPHRPRTVMSADVRVCERGERLVAVLPDGAEFPLLDVFGNAMTNRVMDRFTLRLDGDHSPRVTIDNMVVSRETWRFAAADLDFAGDKSEARRFVRTRQWRAGQELPRFVFVVSATEPRPFFVDFDSPVYVGIFLKAVRRLARKDPTARFTVSEMLPDPEQAWLTDDEGHKYTSELRFVAVDQSEAPR
ncbi:lantibiotic dehydratase [Actinokineospora xionganensis]|uniref:Lantibiotic dehydratase n=1 Tax=Actinokineospora xionganensis TaxID=2684470 RepID=A0ABR7LBX4_9PSEU|nr:lantibiotic dehydratase [Actinokineospora xionganensis]MBC6450159.1 lantibiotic dehydratase [Actinokineospora xionganensis]